MTNKQQQPSNRIDLLMKYVASGHTIINTLKKNSFLNICTGVSCNLQPTSDELCNLQHMRQVPERIHCIYKNNMPDMSSGAVMHPN